MSFEQQAIAFPCAGETLLGTLYRPATAACSTAVLVVTGGPQYRAGSHRQFVLTGRALATAGHPVLLFDARGMGDSTGDLRSFENQSEDIAAAVDALQRACPEARRLVLLGLCDGASAALLFLHENRHVRIDGLCLLNPWARSEATLARTHLKHYYLQRLGQADFWRKLFSGRVGTGRLLELGRSLRSSIQPHAPAPCADARLPFQRAMAEAWRRFQGRILLVISGIDLTAREFLEHAGTSDDWRGLLARPTVSRVDVAGANHTLSDSRAQSAFERALLDWLAASPSGPSARA